jgi:hypothetical protein
VNPMPDQIKYFFKVDIDFKDSVVYIGQAEPKYRADFSRFDMSGLFYGMPDLEYDRDVPSSFGK